MTGPYDNASGMASGLSSAHLEVTGLSSGIRDIDDIDEVPDGPGKQVLDNSFNISRYTHRFTTQF